MNDFVPFSERHGLTPPDAPITIRAEAPDWLRGLFLRIAYGVGVGARAMCEMIYSDLLDPPARLNYGDAGEELRELVRDAKWFQVFGLIEQVATHIRKYHGSARSEAFTSNLNTAFRRKGVGWQLLNDRLEVRGEEPFEVPVRSALNLLQETGRPHARQELHEALRDLSRRPEPDLTGALHHAMAALECVARDLTGEPNLTLGEWLKKHPTAFPHPLGSALDKLWGYASQYGRHVQEGKPANYDEAELVVGLAGALSVYLLRRVAPFPA